MLWRQFFIHFFLQTNLYQFLHLERIFSSLPSVPGVIGCLQALETIKLASMVGEPLSERMLLFDALSARVRVVKFRIPFLLLITLDWISIWRNWLSMVFEQVKIRGRSAQCTVCGDNSSFNKQQFKNFDYEDFTQFPLIAVLFSIFLLSRT